MNDTTERMIASLKKFALERERAKALQGLTSFELMLRTGEECVKQTKDWLTDVHVPEKYTDWYMRGHTPEQLGGQQMYDTLWRAVYVHNQICGRWAMSGYPTVELGHKTAALLMSTKIRPEDAVEFVKSPWPAFVIRLPVPLLKLLAEDNVTQIDANVLGVSCHDGKWSYKLTEPLVRPGTGAMMGLSLWAFNMPTSEFAKPVDEVRSHPEFDAWDQFEVSNLDKRTEQALRNLVMGVCLYLTADKSHHPLMDEGSVTVKSRPSKVRDQLPQYTTHHLQASVRIDLDRLLGNVREYLAKGTHASPSVRTLVQGFWRRQAHGPKHSLRKLKFVAPFWRGPKDGPVTMRVK